MLASASPVLLSLIDNHDDNYLIILPASSDRDLDNLISFIYTGHSNCSDVAEQERLRSLLVLLNVPHHDGGSSSITSPNLAANLQPSSADNEEDGLPALLESSNDASTTTVTMMHLLESQGTEEEEGGKEKKGSPNASVEDEEDKNTSSSFIPAANAPESQFAKPNGMTTSNLPGGEGCCWPPAPSAGTGNESWQDLLASSHHSVHVPEQPTTTPTAAVITDGSQSPLLMTLTTVDRSAILYTFPDGFLGDHQGEGGSTSDSCQSPNSCISGSSSEVSWPSTASEMSMNEVQSPSIFDLVPSLEPVTVRTEDAAQISNDNHGAVKKRGRHHQCSHCDRTFRSKRYLAFHESSVHAAAGSKRFSCDLCPKTFTGARYLRQHARRMHPDGPRHACARCPASFGLRYDLSLHERTHSSLRHVCPECGRGHATLRGLREHRRTHTGERPFECGVCHKRFALPKTLRVHFRQHSGERPYLCPTCGKTFVQNSTLRNHLKNNHKEKLVKVPAGVVT